MRKLPATPQGRLVHHSIQLLTYTTRCQYCVVLLPLSANLCWHWCRCWCCRSVQQTQRVGDTVGRTSDRKAHWRRHLWCVEHVPLLCILRIASHQAWHQTLHEAAFACNFPSSSPKVLSPSLSLSLSLSFVLSFFALPYSYIPPPLLFPLLFSPHKHVFLSLFYTSTHLIVSATLLTCCRGCCVGVVYKGYWHGPVAVKQLRQNNLDPTVYAPVQTILSHLNTPTMLRITPPHLNKPAIFKGSAAHQWNMFIHVYSPYAGYPCGFASSYQHAAPSKE